MGVKPYVVVSNERRGPYSTVVVRGEVDRSEPGQFYMLRGDWGADPMLPRPLSILGEDPSAGTLRFLLKVVGEGTRRLYGFEPGQTVTGLGPLGKPFPRPCTSCAAPLALVGGGVGV